MQNFDHNYLPIYGSQITPKLLAALPVYNSLSDSNKCEISGQQYAIIQIKQRCTNSKSCPIIRN